MWSAGVQDWASGTKEPAVKDSRRKAVILADSEEVPLKDTVNAWLTMGKLSYKMVQTNKTKLLKGTCVSMDLEYAANFQVFVNVTLHAVAAQERGIAQFALNGESTSWLPRFTIAPNSTQIIAHIRHLGACFEIPGPKEGLQLRVQTPVRFMLNEGYATLEVGSYRKQVQAVFTDTKFYATPTDRLWVYLAGPSDRPAKATVGQVSYYANVAPGRGSSSEVAFRLPLREQAAIDERNFSLSRSRKWATFDGFFSFFVVLNGITVGLATDTPAKIWQVTDDIFLCVFILEFALRVFFLWRESWSVTLFLDGWLMFDLVVITCAVLDQWVLLTVELPKVLRTLRLLRLLKLAKLIRIFRSFKELANLMRGLWNTFGTVVWAFILLVIIIYAFALLIVRLVRWDAHVKDDPAVKEWSGVLRAMWSLAQMVILDDWGHQIRVLATHVPGFKGVFIVIALFVFLWLTSCGLLNIVIGIMVQTSCKIDRDQTGQARAEHLAMQQAAATRLRGLLMTWGERPLFKSDKTISFSELFEAITENAEARKAVHEIGLCNEDFLVLCDAFAEDGEVEIQGLCDAIGNICIQNFYSGVSLDEVTGAGEVSESLRPMDVLLFHFSIKKAEASVQDMKTRAQRSCVYVYDILDTIYTRSSRAHTLLGFGNCRPWRPVAAAESREPVHIGTHALSRFATVLSRPALEAKIMMPLDIWTTFLLLFNAFMQTLSSVVYGIGSDRPFIFSIIDLIIALLFFTEFILRITTLCSISFVRQAANDKNEKIERKRYVWLASNMKLKVFPPIPPPASDRVTVSGFTGPTSWVNGLYTFRGWLNGCPYYCRVGKLASYIYKAQEAEVDSKQKEDPATVPLTGWHLGPQLNAPEMQVLAICNFNDPLSLAPLSSAYPWQVNAACMEEDSHLNVSDKPRVSAPRSNSYRVMLQALPAMMKEWSVLLDFLVITFTVIDCVILEGMRRFGNVKMNISAISVLRTVRILRLVTVLRVMKLMPVLQNLFASMAQVWRSCFWLTVIIMFQIYVYALYMVVLVGSETTDPEVANYFGTVSKAVMTGYAIATTDHWGPIVSMIVRVGPVHVIPAMLLMLSVSFVCLKVAVGVLCESTVCIYKLRNAEQSDAEVVLFIRRMGDVSDLVENHLGLNKIPQESLEIAFGVKFATRAHKVGRADGDATFDLGMMARAKDPAFCEKLKDLLEDAKLTGDLVRRMFTAIDLDGTGFLSIALLMKAGMMLRKPSINNVNVYAMSTAVVEIRRCMIQLANRLTETRVKLDTLLKDVASLLHRSRHEQSARPPSPRTLAALTNGAMSAQASQVLELIAAFPPDGTVQDIDCVGSTGEVVVTRGAGMVEVNADNVIGHGTDFRKCLKAGDIIVFERIGTKASEANTCAAICTAVQDATHVRIHRSTKMADIGNGKVTYTIVTLNVAQKAFARSTGDISLSVAPPMQSVSPRSSQRLFEWRLATSGRERTLAWEKRGRLWEDFIQMQRDLQALVLCEIGKDCLQVWRAYAEAQKPVRDRKKNAASGGGLGFRW